MNQDVLAGWPIDDVMGGQLPANAGALMDYQRPPASFS